MAGQQRFLAQLLISLLNAKESESAKVSRLLHDEVGQVLTAVGLQLAVLRMDLQEQIPEVVPRTAEIQQMLEQAVSLVRNLSYEMNPAIVERVGLHYSLERLINRAQPELKGGSIRLFDELDQRLPVEIATAFYRVAEQAVDNAIRHAQATQIQVIVKETRHAVSLEVRDNGCGFIVEQMQQESPGLGLLLMNHYAERGGVSLSVRSTAGKGTAVRVQRLQPGRPRRATRISNLSVNAEERLH